MSEAMTPCPHTTPFDAGEPCSACVIERLRTQLEEARAEKIKVGRLSFIKLGDLVDLKAQLAARDAEAEELRASLQAAKDELRAIKGHDLPIEHGEDDYGLL